MASVNTKSRSSQEATQEFHNALDAAIPDSEIIATWKRALKAKRVSSAFNKKTGRVEHVKSDDHATQIKAAKDIAEFKAGRPRQQMEVPITEDEQTALDKLMAKAVYDPNLRKAMEMSFKLFEMRMLARDAESTGEDGGGELPVSQ